MPEPCGDHGAGREEETPRLLSAACSPGPRAVIRPHPAATVAEPGARRRAEAEASPAVAWPSLPAGSVPRAPPRRRGPVPLWERGGAGLPLRSLPPDGDQFLVSPPRV